jgi:hypothetical protein
VVLNAVLVDAVVQVKLYLELVLNTVHVAVPVKLHLEVVLKKVLVDAVALVVYLDAVAV